MDERRRRGNRVCERGAIECISKNGVAAIRNLTFRSRSHQDAYLVTPPRESRDQVASKIACASGDEDGVRISHCGQS